MSFSTDFYVFHFSFSWPWHSFFYFHFSLFHIVFLVIRFYLFHTGLWDPENKTLEILTHLLLTYYTSKHSPSIHCLFLCSTLFFVLFLMFISFRPLSFAHSSFSLNLPFFPLLKALFSLRRKCIFAKFIQYFLENVLPKCALTFVRNRSSSHE
jgi:hypothetical protein